MIQRLSASLNPLAMKLLVEMRRPCSSEWSDYWAWGMGILDTDSLQRTADVWDVKTLRPDATRNEDLSIQLDGNDKTNATLKTMPLNRMRTSWNTSKVKMCDGTMYVIPR